jgi:hypothetical protein
MAVRYYLGPIVTLTMRGGRIVQGSPLLETFIPGEERVTILKMNRAAPGMDRLAIHRYEATAARIALADTHPLLIPLPADKDERWSDAALTALERAGINRRQAQTSTREIAQLMVAHQRGRALRDRDRTRIVMGHEDV